MAIRHFQKYVGRCMSNQVPVECDEFVSSILDSQVGGKFTFLSGQLIQDEDGLSYFCVFEQEPQVVRSLQTA